MPIARLVDSNTIVIADRAAAALLDDDGRTVKLDVACSIGFAAPFPTPVVLMLSPRSGDAQHVIVEQFVVEPFNAWHEYIDAHGNRCHRLTMPVGRTRWRCAPPSTRPTRSTST